MPANIAHMLIAHKTIERLKTKAGNKVADFANMIDDTSKTKNCRAYMNLGSVGPDLYYYCNIAKPYYRSGKNRKKHRECEVFQDYFLYELFA